MKYQIDKFAGYSAEDCKCQYCLHYAGKGKPCPLELCCCEDEKKQALERAQAKKELPPTDRRRGAPAPQNPVCFDRPECAGCNLAGHGFICGSADGYCLNKFAGAIYRRTAQCLA